MNPIVSFVMYLCSLFALSSSTASTRDGRPHIFGKVEDVDTDFLVDTGASVTVISETLFRRLPNNWKLPQVEVPAGFRLSAATCNFLDVSRLHSSFRLLCKRVIWFGKKTCNCP